MQPETLAELLTKHPLVISRSIAVVGAERVSSLLMQPLIAHFRDDWSKQIVIFLGHIKDASQNSSVKKMETTQVMRSLSVEQRALLFDKLGAGNIRTFASYLALIGDAPIALAGVQKLLDASATYGVKKAQQDLVEETIKHTSPRNNEAPCAWRALLSLLAVARKKTT